VGAGQAKARIAPAVSAPLAKVQRYDSGRHAFKADVHESRLAHLFRQAVGIGKFEILGKYAIAEFTDGELTGGKHLPSYRQNTTDVNLNYIIKEFSARVGLYYLNQADDLPAAPSDKEIGVKLQLQM